MRLLTCTGPNGAVPGSVATDPRSDILLIVAPATQSIRGCLCIIFHMRKFVFLLLLFLGAAFLYLSFGELESIVRTLQQGNIWFILLAVLIQIGWLLAAGLILQSLYRVLDMQDTIYRLTLLSASTTFVNIVAPSIGMGGMAFFILIWILIMLKRRDPV